MSQTVAHRSVPGSLADQAARSLGEAAVACLLGFVVVGLTALACNAWLSAEGLWHAASPAGAFGGAWLLALGGTWHLHVSASLPYGISVPVLNGAAELPWSLFTLEALAVATLVMRRAGRAAAPAPFVAGATFAVNMLLAVLVYGAVSQMGGIPLTTRALGVLAGSGLRQALVATPAASLRWAVTSLLVALASWMGASGPRDRHRGLMGTALGAPAQVALGALRALGVAAVASWVALLVMGIVDARFDRATSLEASLFFFGAPAWAAQGLGLGTAAPMTVKATVLGVGASVRVGMFAHDRAAIWFSVLMLVVVLAATVLGGRRLSRRGGPASGPYALLLGPVFAVLLCAWLAGSGFSVDGKLGSALATIGQVLSQGLLGMAPVVGSTLSGLGSLLFGQASSSGLTIGWGVGALQAFPGALVVGTVGGWLGTRSVTAPVVSRPGGHRRRGEENGPGSPAYSMTPAREEAFGPVVTDRRELVPGGGAGSVRGKSQEPVDPDGNSAPVTVHRTRRTVCALCMSVETGSSTRCSVCGAAL